MSSLIHVLPLTRRETSAAGFFDRWWGKHPVVGFMRGATVNLVDAVDMVDIAKTLAYSNDRFPIGYLYRG
jgi:hypothetical protein